MSNATKSAAGAVINAVPALPSQVKIGAVTYPVEMVANLTEVARAAGECTEDTHLYGDITYSKPLIRINADNAPAFRIKTFMHELMHGVYEQTGDETLRSDEAHINSVANVLAQIFVDNGWTFGAVEANGEEIVEAQDGDYGDYYVYEGVEYRKMKRGACGGERILIVAARMTGGLYDDGDVLIVSKRDEDGVVVDFPEQNDDHWIKDAEYVVLVPLASKGGDSDET